ncbi:MAG: YihY/virulence factor BrkB family protein, partial [Pseudomonadota bacterium]
IVVLPLFLAAFGDNFGYGGRPVSAPTLFFIVMAGAAAIYRIGPSRRPAKLRWVMPGALAAATGWIAASTLLSWYLSNIANYTLMYGSLGTIIALMFWLYISVYILMTGAWLNAEVEHQTLVDTTVGPDRPFGARGATVADTIGSDIGR